MVMLFYSILGREQAAKLLLCSYANIRIKNNNGQTARDVADEQGECFLQDLIEIVDM